MRVLPILFNTDMVRGILDGRKTVTRRVIKGLPDGTYDVKFNGEEWEALFGTVGKGACFDFYKELKLPCQTGDILYVRETWQECCRNTIHSQIVHNKYCFKASVDNPIYGCIDRECGQICNWKPSIHMPKEAARIWLKVTDVRVERLQEMSDDDCVKEGIRAWTKDGKLYKYFPADKEGDYPNCAWSECPRTPKEAMEKIWNSTIKKSDLNRYGWEANPWVWVVEFERCEKPDIRNGGDTSGRR